MRIRLRQSTLVGVFMLVIAALLPFSAHAAAIEVWHYAVVTSAPPSPGAGWGTVSQLLTASGCNGTVCGSNWRPNNDTFTILLENSGDRVTLDHGVGDGTAPYNATVVFRRQTCPTDGVWASGTWHHNFQARSQLVQTSVRTVLSGIQADYYVTLTQRWSSAYYQSFAHSDPCFSAVANPLPTATPIDGSIAPTSTASPPTGQVRITVRVTVSGTPPTSGSASGSGSGDYAPGASVRATASYPSAWDADPTWGGISYSGCGQSGSSWEVLFAAPAADCTLNFTISFITDTLGTTPVPINPCQGGGTPIPDPSYSLWKPLGLSEGGAAPVVTSTVSLIFQQMPIGFGTDLKDWKEQEISLEGPVTGRLMWSFDEGTDHGTTVRSLSEDDRRRRTFTRPDPGLFHLLYGGHPNQPTIQFTTTLSDLPPGLYRLTSTTRNTACTPRVNTAVFSFQVGELTPPIPTAGLYGWARSPHDGATTPFYATKDNPNPMHFDWVYGGALEFYPDVTLQLDPGTGYHADATMTGWHFRGSPPLDVTTLDRTLAYRQPIQILWSKYPPSGLHASGVDVYRVARVDAPVAIAVTVDYTYQIIDSAGLPIGPPLNGSIEGQFTVSLVYTQVLEGGRS